MTARVLYANPANVVADCDCACDLEVKGIRVHIAKGGFERIAALVNEAADALTAAGATVCEAAPAAEAEL